MLVPDFHRAIEAEESSCEPEKSDVDVLEGNVENDPDLVSFLNLSKESVGILASRLNEKHLLTMGTKVTFYQNRDTDLKTLFDESENLVYF